MSSQRADVMEPPVVNRMPTVEDEAPTTNRRTPTWAVLAYVASVGIGVTLIVVAYAMAKRSTTSAHFAVFWAGYLTVLVATAVAGTRRSCTNKLRLLQLVVFGVVSFVPKFLMSVSGAVYFDEFGHWRHASDMLASGHVDVASPFQPIIQFYPGLEALTVGVHEATRLSIWHSGQVVILLAHTLVLLVVWRLARVTRLGEEAAFVAAIVYALNASFLYFDTEYSYESLGLPLAFAAIGCAVFTRRATSRRRAAGWLALSLIAVASVIVTHHVSAFVMCGALLLVFVLVPAQLPAARGGLTQWGPFVIAATAIFGTVLWVFGVAPQTVDYFRPHVSATGTQLADVLLRRHTAAGVAASHTLFSGSAAPAYERVCAFAAQLIAIAVTATALVRSWRDRRDHHRMLLFLPCLLVALAYFASLPLALTNAGGEAAHRVWAYSYLGIALMAAWTWPTWRASIAQRLPKLAGVIAVAALCVVAVGNVAAGESVLYRFPGPYAFGTDTRSHTAETFSVAAWVNDHTARGTRVVTDRDTGEIVTGYTHDDVPAPGDWLVYRLYQQGDAAAPRLRAYLESHRFRYWIVDLRIASQMPQQKLFEGYVGPQSVDPGALLSAGQDSFLHVVYSTEHYRVLAIS